MYNGKGTGDCMHGYFNDMTVDTGKGNPGASGVRFFSNNTGGMRNVTIRSSDPKLVGGIGLDLRQGENGHLIKNVTVIGFDTGIAMDSAFGMTFEHINIENQNKLGFLAANRIAVRGLISKNRVPAIQMMHGWSTLSLIDSELTGGAPDQVAIISEKKPAIYLRNVKQDGYGALVKTSKGELVKETSVKEWAEAEIGAFGKKGEGLMLPVKETPEVPWETDLAKWQVIPEGADTAAVRAAFDTAAKEGKTTVCFPRGDTVKIDRPIRVSGSVTRIVGMESIVDVSDTTGALKADTAVFTFEDLTGPAIVVERFFNLGGWKCPEYITMFENKTSKPFILRNTSHGGAVRYPGGGGEFFVEDVSPGRYGTLKIGKGESAWLRQYNPESPEDVMIEVSGGTLWYLGLKTEGRSTHVSAKNGAKVEVLGGSSYQSWGGQKFDPPMFISDNSDIFFSIGNFAHKQSFSVFAKQAIGSKTEALPKGNKPQNFRMYSR